MFALILGVFGIAVRLYSAPWMALGWLLTWFSGPIIMYGSGYAGGSVSRALGIRLV